MRAVVGCLPTLLLLLVVADVPVAAQDEPPRIGLFVLDIRGSFPQFKKNEDVADSRGLQISELPGRGLGIEAGLHVYPLRWKAVTFGIGAQGTLNRARTSEVLTRDGVLYARAVDERFSTVSPQLSFNFGDGDGWSYISGGFGPAIWAIVPEGSNPTAADEERLRAVNYGGGARWFVKKHLAFHFDVRFYDIDPGTPHFGFPGSPRTKMLIMSGGISLK